MRRRRRGSRRPTTRWWEVAPDPVDSGATRTHAASHSSSPHASLVLSAGTPTTPRNTFDPLQWRRDISTAPHSTCAGVRAWRHTTAALVRPCEWRARPLMYTPSSPYHAGTGHAEAHATDDGYVVAELAVSVCQCRLWSRVVASPLWPLPGSFFFFGYARPHWPACLAWGKKRRRRASHTNDARTHGGRYVVEPAHYHCAPLEPTRPPPQQGEACSHPLPQPPTPSYTIVPVPVHAATRLFRMQHTLVCAPHALEPPASPAPPPPPRPNPLHVQCRGKRLNNGGGQSGHDGQTCVRCWRVECLLAVSLTAWRDCSSASAARVNKLVCYQAARVACPLLDSAFLAPPYSPLTSPA